MLDYLPPVDGWMWVLWIALGAILQSVALLNKHRGDHATARTKKLLGIEPVRPWRPVGIATVLAAAIWAVFHFTTGGI